MTLDLDEPYSRTNPVRLPILKDFTLEVDNICMYFKFKGQKYKNTIM